MSNELRLVADLMCIAARTAPKSAGQDYVVTAVVEGQACRELGEAMIRFGQESGKPNFDRDGKNMLASPIAVLIGIKDARPLGIGCGACGSAECIKPNQLEAEFKGPQCAFRLLDMGIALGSAVKTAGMLNVDNRIMYRVGYIARKMGLIDADYVMGIPLSVTGKSIYFDRRP